MLVTDQFKLDPFGSVEKACELRAGICFDVRHADKKRRDVEQNSK